MIPTSDDSDLESRARALVASHPHVFWLDAGADAKTGTSYLGAGRRVLVAREGCVELDGERVGTDALTVLQDLVADGATGAPPHSTRDPAFRGGWVGVLGYEYGAGLVGVRSTVGDLPDALFVECDMLWSLDHASGRLETLLGDDDLTPGAGEEATMPSDPSRPPEPFGSGPAPAEQWRHDRPAYVRAIEASLDAIARGDAYQICLTNEVRVDTTADPFEVYLRLRRDNPAPYGAFLRVAGVTVAGCSPERFLAVTADGHVETRPIKGTRRRDPDPDVDATLAEDLRADEKERAENLMIVDLMRNDLGRVARLGTVDVPELFTVESYRTVHQLVSTVTATLATGLTGIDAVRASFPAGSMTGAPKHRAMQILGDLEGGPRGLYSGAIGWFGADGALDLAMMIRTIVFTDGQARIGTGGGITALSDPTREVEEILLKARPLLAALGAPATLPDTSA